MPAGGQPDDSQLLDSCASLGIEVYHPPKAPIREAKVTADGSACLVSRGRRSMRGLR